MQILIVEDELALSNAIKKLLEQRGYFADAVYDGDSAVDYATSVNYSLIILDVMLPKIDGFTLCELIRKKSDVPVVMLTARSAEEDQMRGYELKVDEYISKTVSMPLIVSKIGAILRRSSGTTEEERISFNGVVLDPGSHTVQIDGAAVEFTLKEFEILSLIMSAKGAVVTRKSLLSKLWDYEYYDDSRIVDTHIKNIRKKLGERDFIVTVRGIGYKAALS